MFSACSNPYGNPFLSNNTENILKRHHVILIAKFKVISGPFILGKPAQNLKGTLSKAKTHRYASDH